MKSLLFYETFKNEKRELRKNEEEEYEDII